MPGAFKLDHLHPVEPILFSKFYNFFTFILGGQFLLPQRANTEKGEFSQLQKWTRQRGVSAWGIQIGPFAAICTNYVSQILQFFHFHNGEPILFTPVRPKMGKGCFLTPQKRMRQWIFSAWGIQIGPFAAP